MIEIYPILSQPCSSLTDLCCVKCLGGVEQELKEDRYMAPHYAFYVREMKIKAYAQVDQSRAEVKTPMAS